MNIKYFRSILLVWLSLNVSAQNVQTKDGIVIGDRSQLISICTQGISDKLQVIDGLEVNSISYCACFCDNLIPNIYSWELEEAYKANDVYSILQDDDNFKIMFDCVKANMAITEEFKYEYSDLLELSPQAQKDLAIKSCITEYTDLLETEEGLTYDQIVDEEMEKFCGCMVDKLYSEGYTYAEIMDIEDENSVSFNEIMMPCLDLVMEDLIDSEDVNSYIREDIKGDKIISRVPLVEYYNLGFKVKIGISTVEKYYLLDTGASDLVIDREMERELLLEGYLTKADYIGQTEYILANDQVVKADIIQVDNITIGDYTVNNVKIAVVEEGSLLCGISFLNKFRNWEIVPNAKQLILYK